MLYRNGICFGETAGIGQQERLDLAERMERRSAAVQAAIAEIDHARAESQSAESYYKELRRCRDLGFSDIRYGDGVSIKRRHDMLSRDPDQAFCKWQIKAERLRRTQDDFEALVERLNAEVQVSP